MATRFELDAAQREQIVDEMQSVLFDPKFMASKRCVALLRYLLERTLEGDLDGLKERSLGVEVFGRQANYDTNADPIVRTTATEIRKRLAQFYEDSGACHKVKIRLPAGTYHPDFEFDNHERSVPDSDAKSADKALKPFWKQRWCVWSAGALVPLAVVAIAVLGYRHLPTREYPAWTPLLNANSEVVVICVSDDAVLGSETANRDVQSQLIADLISSRKIPPSATDSSSYAAHILFADAMASHKISNFLTGLGRQSILLRSSELTVRDFHRGPVVLLGGLDNPWVLVLLSNLRYSFRIDPSTHDTWIEDSHDPSRREWKRDATSESPFDYALISRFKDDEVKDWIMAVGGLSNWGTIAAAQVITDPAFVQSLPSNIREKNFQLVVRSKLINGSPASQQIVAAYSW